MRPAHVLVGLLLSGCYLAHGRGEPIETPDAGIDGGFDAGFDARPWEPPPGTCTPPEEWRVPRFDGDTQRLRDQQHAERDVFRSCTIGEGCASFDVEVTEGGRVDRAAVERHVLVPATTGGDLPTLELEQLERLAVEAALRRHDGNKRAAAATLGIALKTLYNKLDRYGLRPQR